MAIDSRPAYNTKCTNNSLVFALFEQENKLGLSRNSTVVTMQTPYHDATCGVVLKTKEKYITAGINKANSTNLYPPTKGYLRETCKSQNINPTPTVSFRS